MKKVNNFTNQMKSSAKEIGVELSLEQITKFYKYYQLLIEWNKKINLTAITEISEVISKHFIDSIAILPILEQGKGLSLLDLGTGAGFPGVPLKIAEPSFKVDLVDSLRKRTDFLTMLISELELKEIKAIHSRAEELGKVKEHRENYDVVSSRAVAKLSILSEYCLPFVKVGGKFISLKGPKAADEVKEAEQALEELGGKVQSIKELVLPATEEKRTILVIEKIKNTPDKYPRKAGIPTKRPL